MADHALRGVGLSQNSFEDEEGIEFADRQSIGFDCENNHHFEITFASEADLPTEWECPRCGQVASRSDGVVGEEKEAKPVRTHWDMLRERRSLDELEEIFTEQLDKLRSEPDF